MATTNPVANIGSTGRLAETIAEGPAVGLFDGLRRKDDEPDFTAIYLFTFKVGSGQTEIPPPMIGAYVVAYSFGADPTAAAERAVNAIRTMGYVVTDMEPTGGKFTVGDWDKHIAERWPEFIGHFPKQPDVPSVLARENVILGPFAGYERQH